MAQEEVHPPPVWYNNEHDAKSAIVSGSETNDHYSENSSSLEQDSKMKVNLGDGSSDENAGENSSNEINLMYNSALDDEDEAWVYKYKRGGLEETVSVRHSTVPSQSQDRSDVKKSRLLKPRTSDAILSCPCCFEIVCMDCQRHERYTNQFRAMFVMNIGVSWDVTICPENFGKSNTQKNTVPENDTNNDERAYFSVHCSNCKTVVAALDMKDEIYHFFGCLASG